MSAPAAKVALLSPKSLPIVLGEVLGPGMRAVALMNRSGLLIGCAGDAATAPSVGAIASSMWQMHEKCDGQGGLGCLLLECEHGRLSMKAVGSFILVCYSDSTVPLGLLKAKLSVLSVCLGPSLSQIC